MMPRRKLTAKDKATILARDNHTCAVCRYALKDDDEIDFDHEIPLEIGGKDTLDNIRALHRKPCHANKTKFDIKLIAKSRRIRKKLAGEGPTKRPIKSRGFDKTKRRTLAGKVIERVGAAKMAHGKRYRMEQGR